MHSSIANKPSFCTAINTSWSESDTDCDSRKAEQQIDNPQISRRRSYAQRAEIVWLYMNMKYLKSVLKVKSTLFQDLFVVNLESKIKVSVPKCWWEWRLFGQKHLQGLPGTSEKRMVIDCHRNESVRMNQKLAKKKMELHNYRYQFIF